jgi:endogenous inhibitor of DNA gyrase (YacG/DUF329 family)
MPCPICGKPVSLDDPFLPFCSERCREIDLGNWASEKYVIPGGAVHQQDQQPDEDDSE